MTILPFKSLRRRSGQAQDINNQSGQALLIVLLTMAVILTLVLSVVSRSVTDVTITTYEEDALRAFSAAEAGIEKTLLNPVPGPITQTFTDLPDTSVYYQGDVTEPTESDRSFIFPSSIYSGEVATFWLVSHANDGSLTCSGEPCFSGAGVMRFCWGNRPESALPMAQRPAIQTLLFYDNGSPPLSVAQPTNDYANVQVARFTSDFNAGAHGNSFTSTGVTRNNCTIEGKDFLYRSQAITPPSVGCQNTAGCRLLLKVRMYYNQTPQPIGITITGGVDLPAQGFQISSTGTAGESTRKVNVFQSYADSPSLFDNAVFSMKDLIKP